MKFSIEFTGYSEQKSLIYHEEEHSFDMEPYNYSTDLHLALNYLDLAVLDKKVIQVSGFPVGMPVIMEILMGMAFKIY